MFSFHKTGFSRRSASFRNSAGGNRSLCDVRLRSSAGWPKSAVLDANRNCAILWWLFFETYVKCWFYSYSAEQSPRWSGRRQSCAIFQRWRNRPTSVGLRPGSQIPRNTDFRRRHKVNDAVNQQYNQDELKGIVSLDKTFYTKIDKHPSLTMMKRGISDKKSIFVIPLMKNKFPGLFYRFLTHTF